MVQRFNLRGKELLLVVQSCSIHGAKSAVDSAGAFHPSTVISVKVEVRAMPHEVGYFEFEDLDFNTTDNFNVGCDGRGKIVFRRCRFRSRQGTFGSGQEIGEERMSMTFENCTFSNYIPVNSSMTLTMINCVSRCTLTPCIHIQLNASAFLHFVVLKAMHTSLRFPLFKRGTACRCLIVW